LGRWATDGFTRKNQLHGVSNSVLGTAYSVKWLPRTCNGAFPPPYMYSGTFHILLDKQWTYFCPDPRVSKQYLSWIWGSHGDDSEEYNLLVCNATNSVEVHWRFGVTYCLHLKGQRVSHTNSQGETWAPLQDYIWINVFTRGSHCFLLVSSWLVAWLTPRPWKWKQYVPHKHRWTSTGLHGVTPQNIVLFNIYVTVIVFNWQFWIITGDYEYIPTLILYNRRLLFITTGLFASTLSLYQVYIHHMCI
jgi:hypothetical protein